MSPAIDLVSCVSPVYRACGSMQGQMLERSILIYSPIPRELVPESLSFGGLKQNGRVPLPLWRGQRQANLLFVFD